MYDCLILCERAGAEYFPVASKLRSAPRTGRSLRNECLYDKQTNQIGAGRDPPGSVPLTGTVLVKGQSRCRHVARLSYSGPRGLH
jgi:hypothetical protein